MSTYALPSLAQTVSTYQEQGKLIRAPRDIARLGEDLFGDKVNLYTGGLEFVQTDVSIPGNSALPVAVGRRLVTGQEFASLVGARAAFGKWDLEIPHLHGIFASAGWAAGLGTDPAARCSNFGPPPFANGSFGSSNSSWAPTEFWHGSFLYVPGAGDQEMLRRNGSHTQAPGSNPGAYPVVTRNNWAIRCLPAMDPRNGAPGEAFIAVSPDGTEYRFDWIVSRRMSNLSKSNVSPDMSAASAAADLSSVGATTPAARHSARTTQDQLADNATTAMQAVRVPGGGGTVDSVQGNVLTRAEYWILPTTVTDRHGNVVTYTYDSTNKWRVNSIVSAEAGAPARSLTFSYGIAGTDYITAVSDGTRTWNYGYVGGTDLDTVTMPDGSSWKELSALSPLLSSIDYLGEGGCESPGNLNVRGVNGHLVHPSGARGEFWLTATRHGRSGVTMDCPTDPTYNTTAAKYPKIFDTFALTRKEISGPGLALMQWTTAYAPEASSWGPCAGCNAVTQVTVTEPSNAQKRMTFGTLFKQTEGQLLQTETLDTAGNVLSSVLQEYAEPIPPRGISDQPRGDGEMSARITETRKRQTTQQGVNFVWEALGFDAYAKPVSVSRTSALGSRTENLSYENNLNKWVLGQTRTVTEASTGKVMVSNVYNATTALPESVSKFGLLQQSMTYYADGTVQTRSDGLGHATTFYNYMRGLPRNVTYPDSSTESAEINNDGTIAAVTDAVGLRTAYDYDAGGRLRQISYPGMTGDPAWTPTTIAFTQIMADEYGVGPGHWRQDVVQGNAISNVMMDALWRPVFSQTYDAGNVAASISRIKNRYDHAGRTTFTSYPAREFSDTGVNTTYNALGQPIEVRADSELGPLTTTTYYNAGFSKTVVDARGNSSTTSYQAFDTPAEDAISAIGAPEGLTVNIARDVFGKPTAITRSGTNAAGVYAVATRSYVYDGYERLCKTIEPETGATLQQLDAANNVSWRAPGTALTSATCDWGSVAGSAQIAFGYDAMNRLRTTTYGDGSAAISRTYWADGQPQSVSSAGAVWTMNYNGRRLLTTQSLAFEGQTYTLRTDYNANGHPIQLTYPAATNSIGNQSVAYDPDALGRPSHIGAYASALQYHPSGAVAGFTYGNGKTRAMTQNLRGLPSLAQDSGVLSDAYGYDQNGNVTAITDQIGAGPGGASTSRGMAYDGLDRLTVANAPAIWGNASYGYDVLDNIRNSTIGGRANTYNYSTRNLLDRLQSTAGGFSYNYAYDNRGNVTWRNNQNFGFDLGNRLTTAANLDTYTYDGFGRRVKTTAVDGSVTVSVYSPAGQILYTRRTGGPNPPQSTQYIYLHNHQIAEVKK